MLACCWHRCRRTYITADIGRAFADLAPRRGGIAAWAAAATYGQELFERLIVLALPHLGIWQANMTSEQLRKSFYIAKFQVWAAAGRAENRETS
jgi:hypothetical protein